MKNNRSAAEPGILKALLVSICLATVARAGLTYLPVTGPAPLRMLAMKAPKQPPVASAQTAPVHAAPAHPDLDCTNELAANLNPINTAATNIISPYPIPPVSIGAGNPLESPFGSHDRILELPTPELFSITPQMLATYFHPVANETNGEVIVGPLPVGFIPPLAQPEKSSHAEYIVK